MGLTWWGPCPKHGDNQGRYLYPDGLCTTHSPLSILGGAEVGCGGPHLPSAGPLGSTPIIASGDSKGVSRQVAL